MAYTTFPLCDCIANHVCLDQAPIYFDDVFSCASLTTYLKHA